MDDDDGFDPWDDKDRIEWLLPPRIISGLAIPLIISYVDAEFRPSTDRTVVVHSLLGEQLHRATHLVAKDKRKRADRTFLFAGITQPRCGSTKLAIENFEHWIVEQAVLQWELAQGGKPVGNLQYLSRRSRSGQYLRPRDWTADD